MFLTKRAELLALNSWTVDISKREPVHQNFNQFCVKTIQVGLRHLLNRPYKWKIFHCSVPWIRLANSSTPQALSHPTTRTSRYSDHPRRTLYKQSIACQHGKPHVKTTIQHYMLIYRVNTIRRNTICLPSPPINLQIIPFTTSITTHSETHIFFITMRLLPLT